MPGAAACIQEAPHGTLPPLSRRPICERALGTLPVPTLILHGRHDKVIPLDKAMETAEAIPGATIEVDDTMGHDGPPRLRKSWGERIAAHLQAIQTAV